MTRIVTVIVGLLLLVSSPAPAQDASGTITKWFLSTITPGHDLEWEEAFKAHLEWRRQQNDTWVWHTYKVVSGDRLGQYLTMTTDHAWANFDAPAVPVREDEADRVAKLGPHIESLSSGFWTELKALSRPPDMVPPFPLIQVVDYGVKVGQRATFELNVAQFGQTVDEQNLSAAYLWFMKPDGGAATRTFRRIVPYANWGALGAGPGGAVNYDPFIATHGQAGLERWIEMFAESVDWLTSEFWEYRPDLSYIP